MTSFRDQLRRGTVALAMIAGLFTTVTSSFAAAGGNGNGTVPLLVQSKVPLTADVVASIASHAAQVSYVWPEINAMALTATPSKIAELVADPYVGVVEPDLQSQVPNDDPQMAEAAAEPSSILVPIFSSSTPIQTWNQDMSDTSGSGYSGAGVTVVVLDSGLPQNWQEFMPEGSVDLEHAAGFGAEGWGDFHNPVNAVRGAGGHIGLFPHGLAVATVIVGFPSDFGPVMGSAPGAKILPIRVFNQFNFGWNSWITAGILHAAGLKTSGAVPGPMVINYSGQSTGFSTIMTSAINYATSQGVLFVTIAGNFGPGYGSVAFPGRLPQCITAGAVGWKGEGGPIVGGLPWFFQNLPENNASQAYVAFFSGRESLSVPPASQIDVLAPGSWVFGEWIFGPGFSEGREVAFDALDNFIFGTSFAAPHVTGIVAQMLQKNPGLSQSAAEGYLRSTALAIPASGPGCTPLSCFAAWDARATGAGLARGMTAVAVVP